LQLTSLSLQFVANRFYSPNAARTVHFIAATQPTKEMNMNTSKIVAVVATIVVNAVLATAVVSLFERSTDSKVQVAKVESITIIAKRVAA
jgi:hypothetical protein